MRVRVREVALAVTDCVTRLPFRFGMNTMTWAPTLSARVELETDGGVAVGCSADLLVPKWFEKDPGKSLQQDIEGLMASARLAAEAARTEPMRTVFDLWWHVYRARVHSRPESDSDRLVRGFGVALIERAVLDAACRAARMSFFEALKADLFGMRPGTVHPELEDWSVSQSLPDVPRSRVDLRHTVGLVDHLRAASIDSAARVDDGLPESLEEDIRAYGLTWFKLKLSGDPGVDLPRTLEFADVLTEHVEGEFNLTVDGNEQYRDPADLVRFLGQLDGEPAGRQLLSRLVCIEQPLPRAISLEDGVRSGLAALSEFAPVILDEADHGVEAFPRALDLGYGGISLKNCKGVLRALLHRGLCEVRGGFQSAEDLTNLGVLAVQQDLATVAALGLSHVERNGHHYFRGLGHLSKAEASSAADAHPDLWTSDGGLTQLRVEEGQLQIGSLQCEGYGHAAEIDWDSRTPLADWKYQERPVGV